MDYIKLSELLNKLQNPQRSDTFVKLIRAAVREGAVEGTELTGRIPLPKQFKALDGAPPRIQRVKEMLFLNDAAFKRWVEQADRSLTRQVKTRPRTLESIVSGQHDFKALAADTRRSLQASYEKGQKLGRDRKADLSKPAGRGAKAKPATRGAKRR